jgi:hypothetical protein
MPAAPRLSNVLLRKLTFTPPSRLKRFTAKGEKSTHKEREREREGGGAGRWIGARSLAPMFSRSGPDAYVILPSRVIGSLVGEIYYALNGRIFNDSVATRER